MSNSLKLKIMTNFKLLLAFLTLIPLCLFAEDIKPGHTFTVDNIKYVVRSNYVCEVTRGSTVVNYTINIPATVSYNGRVYRVNGIANSAFEDWGLIKNLTIAKGVTFIGQRAFAGFFKTSPVYQDKYHLISKIVIPNTITDIGGFAFHNANGNLSNMRPTELIIEDGTSKLFGGSNVDYLINDVYTEPFSDLNIQKLYLGRNINFDLFGNSLSRNSELEIEIGDNVTELTTITLLGTVGRSESYYPNTRPKGLKKLTIGKGLSTVPDFKEGIRLSEVYVKAKSPQKAEGFNSTTYTNATLYVPRGTKSLYQNAAVWKNFSTIKEYDLDSGDDPGEGPGEDSDTSELAYEYEDHENSGNATVIKPQGKVYSGNITIPKNVKKNGKEYQVLEIGEGAFEGCESLTSVTAEGVSLISAKAFKNCKKLSTVNMPNVKFLSGDEIFSGCENLSSLQLNKDGVQGIMFERVFYNCKKLKSINIDMDCVIGKEIFYGCESLESVTFTDVVNYIQERAFQGCNSLKEIDLPKSVSTVFEGAFSNCTNLTTVIVRGSVQDNYIGLPSLYEGCFSNLPRLKDFYCYNKVPPSFFGANGFTGTYLGSVTLHVPASAVDTYKKNTPWSNFGKIVGDANSSGNDPEENTESSNLNYEIKIYDDSFSYAIVTKAEGTQYSGAIDIPEKIIKDGNTYHVLYIGEGAFEGCKNITSVTANNISGIYDRAFKDCTGLTTVNLPNLKYIWGKENFSGCKELISIAINPDFESTDLADRLFYDCEKLTSFDMPSKITRVGEEVFSGCKSLKHIDMSNIRIISKGLFKDCEKLNSIILSSTTDFINQEAFSGCKSLENINLTNVEKLFNRAFYGCEKLTSLGSTNKVTHIGQEAFYGCKNLLSFDFADGLESILSQSFYGCSGLTTIYIPESITSIGEKAFYGCNSLTEITIPRNVMYIGDDSFSSCANVSKIVIEGDDESWLFFNIDFCDLPKLKEFYCYYKQPPILTKNETFSNTNIKNATLYVPASAIELYKTTAPWSGFGKITASQTGIHPISIESSDNHIYNMHGIHIEKPRKGVNIIRHADGSTRKVMVK